MSLNGKRVLVTGADGFIGSHLVEMLLKKGAKIRALSQYNSFNNWGWLEDLDSLNQIEVVCGDVRDPFFCKNITKDIDVVFHLAALIAIPYSYAAPQSYVETNVIGTLNMCQGALEAGCEKILVTSTSEVYGTAQYVPIDEKHPLQPQSPYSASKIGADAMALSYFYSFKLPVTVVRPFNTYGPRQSARAVIPTIITQLLSGYPQIKLGDVKTTRDFNFVKDTCKGILELAICTQNNGEAVNIGSNKEATVLEVFETLKRITGSQANFVLDESRIRPEASEVYRLLCDNSRIKTLTGYQQDYSLSQGLAETVKWFEKNLSKYKPQIYNI